MGRSEFLFPDTSFAEGAGSVLDLFGELAQYNTSRTEREADLRALRSDWAAVGDYLWIALAKTAATLSEKQRNSAIRG
ncbi:MAG: hypothetical protein AMXMBFR80_03130 [Dehalococcoidia bacterium]|jgi:hypothetical protein|nr:hypothetical protein [Tepidiformaceae bacterium]